jgi:hypothetical protein
MEDQGEKAFPGRGTPTTKNYASYSGKISGSKKRSRS